MHLALEPVCLGLRRFLESHFDPDTAFTLAFRSMAQKMAPGIGPGLSLFSQELPAIEREISQGIDQLLDQLPPQVWSQATSLGWAYQHWNRESRESLYQGERAKIEPEALSLATGVYTEEYMTAFLVENGLGRGADNWAYRRLPWAETPLEELTVLDPAAGAGHILLQALDRLVDLYQREGGLPPREIPRRVIEDHLFGLEIDEKALILAQASLAIRCHQLGGDPPQVWNLAAVSRVDPRLLHAHPQLATLPILGSLFWEPSDLTGLTTFPGGEEIERFLSILRSQYHLVVTNPPYLGSGQMPGVLKETLQARYPKGKGDLYAAFILRGLELTRPGGRVAVVTRKAWLYLKEYTPLRQELLSQFQWEILADLGPRAFQSHQKLHDGVSVTLLVLSQRPPQSPMLSIRALSAPDPESKAEFLRAVAKDRIFRHPQQAFTHLLGSPIVYWLPEQLLEILGQGPRLGEVARVSRGVDTCENQRFLRCWWEEPGRGWCRYVKAGGYRRWSGLEYWQLDWREEGARLKAHLLQRYPYLKNTDWLIKPETFRKEGWTYSLLANGSLGARILDGETITDSTSPGVFLDDPDLGLGALLNSRLASTLLRALSPDLTFREGYLAQLPLPSKPLDVEPWVQICLGASRGDQARDPLEKGILKLGPLKETFRVEWQSALRDWALAHTAEALIDQEVNRAYGLDQASIKAIGELMGALAGELPLVKDLGFVPPEFGESLVDHPQIHWDPQKRQEAVASVRQWCTTGWPRTPRGDGHPFPTQTPLEEVSLALGVHPLSACEVLLQCLEEGEFPQPDWEAWVADRLTSMILALLEERGWIPLTPLKDYPTLGELLQLRWGDLVSQAQEVLGSLEKWLTQKWIPYHNRRFLRRPLAIQVQSSKRRSELSFLVSTRSLSFALLTRIIEALSPPVTPEVERLLAGLERIRDQGFPSLVGGEEPLDGWASPDGRSLPQTREEWVAQEQEYHPNPSDGVQVNIAPWVPFLHSSPLSAKDAQRLLAARARWRRDEREWARQGRIARLGWWND